MAELKLRVQIEGNTEKTVFVERDEFKMGRSPECDLHLPYGSISRTHARFVKTPSGEWIIEDMGSKNGTLLNESFVTSPQKVNHGDVIRLGNVFISVIFTERPQTKPPISVHPQTKPPLDYSSQPTTTPQPRATLQTTIAPGITILRNAKDLQQQWIQADAPGDVLSNKERAIARLKDLVDIAKGLNSAESIEAIFSQVQKVVFREIKSVDRLALLIDVSGTGKLELMNSAARDIAEQQHLAAHGNWISRSICQKVFSEKVAIHTADAQSDERFDGEQSILFKGIRSAMAVPLWDENKVVGVLYADAHLRRRDWAQEGEEDLSFFSALANLVASSVQRWLLTRKLRNEETIRQKLERYHSPAVVQQLIAAGTLQGGRLPPTEEDVSILFADIVGFTALSERLTPAQIANLLNDFFEEMLKEVFAFGGTLDKFIGDCIMAFFGAPERQPDHAERAVAAAKGMLTRLERLNTDRILSEPLQLRIAINSGKVVVGDVGSSQRVDYTVLGAPVNLASRMEGICPPGECVISENTYALLKSPAGFEVMGEYRFKGIDKPVLIYQTKRNS
ncbi:MAG: FHA domain-containing protein [Oscillatoriaceae bacterium SKW80]|nr:FHA domain-containing protein [Oscillatoriaceae bacterium SKYG93]MCX8122049.1 FHA domain-containing protein [Oscillatoriaceae bacterium SKW80]MDW8454336.1 adenylate/guanylate cyclase domain-containing protein [Oscillatoriaceae cyanobacterium SKYGB_i_bin93]HIK29200.1 FHA domain-containing protein [Oscillatoriaceae cyanobacterium M7585_C2015_266]